MCPNAVGVRRSAVGAEDRAANARGVSMQVVGPEERCKLPQRVGRSPAAKRHLVHSLFENVLSGKALAS